MDLLNETAAPISHIGSGQVDTSKSQNVAEKADRFKAQREWRERNPLKVWCHSATNSAIKRGVLVRPDRCDECGTIGPVDAHHEDHTRPLHVRWLDRPCHARLHARLRCEVADG